MRRLVLLGVMVVASLATLSLSNASLSTYYKHVAPHHGLLASLPFLATAAGALAFMKERYGQFVPLLRVSIRSSAVGLLVYLVIEPPQFTVAAAELAGQATYVHLAYYAALALGVASVLVPSLIIPVVVYVISTRQLIDDISGIPSSTLDIRYMLDMALYLSVAGLVTSRIRFDAPKWASYRAQKEITFIAFGLHLSNYFWSGIAKLALGPYLWTWPLENRTYSIIPYAIEKGASPFGHSPLVAQWSYEVMQLVAVPANSAIVLFQVFAIVCVLRLAWLKLATLFYDVLHISIYVFSGILFWPWIWNNFTILMAAQSMRGRIPKTCQVVCILTIALSYPSLGLYKAAWLGWFDVTDARQMHIEAVTENGRSRVPPSFFLSHSFGVSLGYMDTAAHEGHYEHTNWNSSRDHSRHASSGTCPTPPAKPPRAESAHQREARLARLSRFIRAHHAKMVERQAALGKYSYYLRMHHHPSNPFLFWQFAQTDLRQVRGYDLVLESVCHDIHNGQVSKRVVGRTVEHFSVR